MAPSFLLPEQTVRQDGQGPAVAVSDVSTSVQITLGITRVLEQQSIDVSIHGSPDGEKWDAKPLAAFPQKFYCGVYTLIVDLSRHPEVRFLRAQWKVNRWGRGEPKPLFSIYLFAEPSEIQIAAASASAVA